MCYTCKNVLNMKDLAPLLRSLGLLDSEIKVYVAGLTRGAGTILDFTKATHLSRQAVYTAVDALTERGLFTNVMRGKKRYFAAEQPNKLIAYAHRYHSDVAGKIADLEQMLPELTLQAGGDKPIVRLFEGKEGVRAIMEDWANTDFKEMDEIADADALFTVLTPQDLQPLRNILRKRSVRMRGLYGGTSGSSDSGERYYVAGKDGEFKAHIGVYGDKINLVTFEGKMYSAIIESKRLAQTLRTLFHFAFVGAKAQRKESSRKS